MPQLQDPNFARTVVLLCDFLPEGAFGLVLNRPTDAAASDDGAARSAGRARQRSAALHRRTGRARPRLDSRSPTSRSEQEYRTIVDGLYLSTSPLLLRRVLETQPAPRALVLAGYAGWGPGQLDEELEQSAWLMSDVELDLVFDTDPGDDVGDRDSPARRRPVGAADEPRRSLT